MKKLEIGAGTIRKNGFMHHDIRELEGIDIVCDARKFPDTYKGYFDEVHASNIIEHFNRFEIEKVLTEWCSLVKVGGYITIIAPDVREISRQLVEGYIDIPFFSYLIYGGQDYDFNKHFYGFDLEYISQLLIKRNFGITLLKPGKKFECVEKGKKYCPMLTVTGVRLR